MGFFDKFRAAVSRFMSGRYGSDQLNLTMVIGALIVTTIGSLSGVYFLTLAADALLLLAIFRMFSKDRYRRAASEISPSPANSAAQNSIRKRKLPKRAVRELHT